MGDTPQTVMTTRAPAVLKKTFLTIVTVMNSSSSSSDEQQRVARMREEATLLLSPSYQLQSYSNGTLFDAYIYFL